MPVEKFLDVEIRLGHGPVRLLCPQRQEYLGEGRFDDRLRHQLLELEHAGNHRAYGKTLFEATFPAGTQTHRGLYSTLDSARQGKSRLRLRLCFEPGTLPGFQALHWELLNDGEDFEISRSPETAFSRYVAQPVPIGTPPVKPRLLCVIAAPTNSHRYKLAPIDYHLVASRFRGCLAGLQGRLDVVLLERPVTPEKLREKLQEGTFHFLHFHGHGMVPRDEEAALVLEDEQHRAQFTKESTLRDILLGLRSLKLVTLVACHGAAPTTQRTGLGGLAGSLVRSQVPAVIAMRRAISMEMGETFTKILYQQLAQREPVDAAVNEARHRLYMSKPERIDWSSPILYMRLADGMLWPAVSKPPNLLEESPEVPKPPRKERRLPKLLAGLLLLLVLGFAYAKSHVKSDLGPGFIGGGSVDTEPPPSDPLKELPETEVEIPIQPIQALTLGVGAIDRNNGSWNGDAARTFQRRLREDFPGYKIVLLDKPFRARLPELYDGNLSLLPGGDRAPQGLEHLFLIAETHDPHPNSRGGFPNVRVSCDVLVLDTRKAEVILNRSVSHTGMETTESGALEQAFGRCIDPSLKEVL